MAGPTRGVTILGLKETQKALKGCELAVRREIRARLKPVGEIVQREIVSRARSGPSGDLKKKLKVAVSPARFRVAVVSKARHPWNPAHAGQRSGGKTPRWVPAYNYGKRLEFDPRYRGKYAFFYPGYAAKKNEAVREFVKVVNAVVREFRGGA